MGLPDAAGVRKELRTYQIFDRAGNSLVVVEKVKRNDHHISVKVISLQYGQNAATSLPRNRQSFDWSIAKDGSLKELDQEFRSDPGEESPRVEADFLSAKDQTVIVQKEPEPKTTSVKPGLLLLRMVTAGGLLSIEF
jgi:hypothetical protein